MGLRVLHKGLILVAVPLILQFIIIAVLGFLLYQCDREQAREAERCRLSMLGSRLLFANCEAGALLIAALKQQNMRLLNHFYQDCDKIDDLNKQMSDVPEDDVLEGRKLQLRCLKAQSAVTARLREMADLIGEGMNLDTVKLLNASHRKLVKELDLTLTLLRKRYQDLDAGLPAKWESIAKLQKTEAIILFTALAANLALASLLYLFYRNQFVIRINKTKSDVESLTRGQALSAPLSGTDEIASLDASFRNMSMQLAAAAERERALFENSSDMICVLDENLNFVRVNTASARLCGWQADALVGESVSSILESAAFKDIEQRLLSARTTQTAAQYEAAVETSSGGRISTLWSVFWSPDQKSCHCVVHDVSEERELDKLRESFLRLIAADFREPLTDIAGLVDKLSSGKCGDLPETATSKIVSATGTLSRMVSLVDELIQLETVKNTSLNLNKQEHKVIDALSASVKDTEALSGRRGITIKIDCPDDLVFEVDFDKIVRVITNFMSNAIKFSPEGATVVLRAELHEQNCAGANGRSINMSLAETLRLRGQDPSLAETLRLPRQSTGSCAAVNQLQDGRIGVVNTDPSLAETTRLPGRDPSLAETARIPGRDPSLAETVRLPGRDPSLAETVRLPGNLPSFADTVEVSGIEEPGVVISAIDQGRGIPKEMIGTLFQAFKQVSSSDGKRGKGTGLGLVVCKRIVEEHGGRVGVESEEGQGTCFWFLIPEPSRASAQTAKETATGGNTHSGILLPADRKLKTNFWSRLSMKQKGMLLIGLPLLFQGIFVLAMIYFMHESQQSFSKQMHDRNISRSAIRLTIPYFRLLVALRGSEQKAVGLNVCREVQAESRERIERFRESCQGDPLAMPNCEMIGRYLSATLIPMTQSLADAIAEYGGRLDDLENRRFANVIVMYNAGLAGRVQRLADVVGARDKGTPLRLKELRKYETAALLAALIFNIAAAAWLAIYFSADVVRRLLVLSDNSQRLAIGAELNDPISGTDEIAHLDNVFHDTAKRLAEARATESTFLDNANNIICTLDEQGRFVSLNRVAADKLSLPFDKIAEYKLQSLVLEEQKATFEKFLENTKERSGPSVIELRVASEEHYLDTLWSVLWSQKEALYFAVAYDITARRELDRMKKEFLALVTHDLRTPLTTIQGMSILLEAGAMGALPEAARSCLSQIKLETKQILELVNDLLDLSKLEAGELKCEFTQMSARALLSKIEEQLKEAGISVIVKEPAADFDLEADTDRLPYAIAGMALELFAASSSPLNLVASKEGSSVHLKFSGQSSCISQEGYDGINSQDDSSYSESSARRLRLPLSKQIIMLHHGKVLAKSPNPDKTDLEISLSSKAS